MKMQLVLTPKSFAVIGMAVLVLGVTTATAATDLLKGPPPPPPPFSVSMVNVDQPVVHSGATNMTILIVANTQITFSTASYGLFFEKLAANGTWVFYRSVPGNNVTTVLNAGQNVTLVYNFLLGTFPLGQYRIHSIGQSGGNQVEATYAFKGEYQG